MHTPHTNPTTTPNRGRVLLTVEEAAQQLSIGRTTMYALIKAGHITTVRIGHLRRVPADALTTYVQQLTKTQHTAA
ncbi:excisionase family DNA binding protein [Saccharomonospora amisosensis]|uniref:Excisionase family DNA binding protein n=1 Tax=Saccharomonospora amisosensis TaxID=1128677 RepID=A0A7X5ZNN1_9PSEU|nr:helix-turn-helix domain-containing protein [Saccharomonospora amisosensis]NIJ09893.1 excisionase family DNA binding protein [Saccharomonospora amisosensis]